MRVGLVLGGGGAVGLAYHAAALAALEHELEWDPRDAEVIVGTSAGAVIAALLRRGVSAADLAGYAASIKTARAMREREGLDQADKAQADLVRRLAEPVELTPEKVQEITATLLHRLRVAAEQGKKELQVMRFPVRNPATNEVVGVGSVGIDITSQVRAHRELKELSQTLEHKVSERTRELAIANAELAEAKQAQSAFVDRIDRGTPEELVGSPADDYVENFTRDVPRSQVLTLRWIMREPGPADPQDGPKLDVTTTMRKAVPVLAASEKPVCCVEDGRVVGIVDREAVLTAIAQEGDATG